MKNLFGKIFLILIIAFVSGIMLKACKRWVCVHYLDNEAVNITGKLYSPDSSVAVVHYLLDIGARGLAHYKTILRTEDYQQDLSRFHIPPELHVIKWIDNNNLLVKYDPNVLNIEGSAFSDSTIHKEKLIVIGINLIVAERVPLKPVVKEEIRYDWNEQLN